MGTERRRAILGFVRRSRSYRGDFSDIASSLLLSSDSASTTWFVNAVLELQNRLRAIQSKVLNKKLQLLAEHADFHVNINSVVGGGVRNPNDALVLGRRARQLGFIVIVNDAHGFASVKMEWCTTTACSSAVRHGIDECTLSYIRPEFLTGQLCPAVRRSLCTSGGLP
jgi:hypothetical protein